MIINAEKVFAAKVAYDKERLRKPKGKRKRWTYEDEVEV